MLLATPGRWLSRDPLGEAGGINLYAYCGNDPVNRHDPLGLTDVPGMRMVDPKAYDKRHLDNHAAFNSEGATVVDSLLYNLNTAQIELDELELMAKLLRYQTIAGKGSVGLKFDELALSNDASAYVSGFLQHQFLLSIEENFMTAGVALNHGDLEVGIKSLLWGGVATFDAATFFSSVIPKPKYSMQLGIVPQELRGVLGMKITSAGKAGVSSVTVHHIATEYGNWAKQFEKLFEGAGMTLQNPLNKISIPGHVGPHGVYNPIVFQRLADTVKGLTPGTPVYRIAFYREMIRLRRDVLDPTNPLGGLIRTRPTRLAGC